MIHFLLSSQNSQWPVQFWKTGGTNPWQQPAWRWYGFSWNAPCTHTDVKQKQNILLTPFGLSICLSRKNAVGGRGGEVNLQWYSILTREERKQNSKSLHFTLTRWNLIDPLTHKQLNPSRTNIDIQIFHTFLYTFLRVLTRRICLTIKSFLSRWWFPSFWWPERFNP